MTNEQMTNEQEERFIIDMVISKRHQVETLKKEQAALKTRIALAESAEFEAEQALIDFYESCGVNKSECGDYTITLGQSKSVDVANLDSVPDKYIRTKITKEVNKALIKAEGLPANNWLSYSTKTTITIKHKDA